MVGPALCDRWGTWTRQAGGTGAGHHLRSESVLRPLLLGEGESLSLSQRQRQRQKGEEREGVILHASVSTVQPIASDI